MLDPPAERDCFEVTDETPSRWLSITDLLVGRSVTQRYVFSPEALKSFGELAKDRAPVHTNPAFARAVGFDEPIVQGLALATRFSRLIGMYLPGERAVLETINLRYRAPVYAGRELLYRCTVSRIFRPLNVARLALAVEMDGDERVTGECQCLVR